MFGFLTSGTKDITDPLASAKSVASWLRQLPALDVIGRQQHVMRAFDAMRQSRKPIDVTRVQAVEFLDVAPVDRRVRRIVVSHRLTAGSGGRAGEGEEVLAALQAAG